MAKFVQLLKIASRIAGDGGSRRFDEGCASCEASVVDGVVVHEADCDREDDED